MDNRKMPDLTAFVNIGPRCNVEDLSRLQSNMVDMLECKNFSNTSQDMVEGMVRQASTNYDPSLFDPMAKALFQPILKGPTTNILSDSPYLEAMNIKVSKSELIERYYHQPGLTPNPYGISRTFQGFLQQAPIAKTEDMSLLKVKLVLTDVYDWTICDMPASEILKFAEKYYKNEFADRSMTFEQWLDSKIVGLSNEKYVLERKCGQYLSICGSVNCSLISPMPSQMVERVKGIYKRECGHPDHALIGLRGFIIWLDSKLNFNNNQKPSKNEKEQVLSVDFGILTGCKGEGISRTSKCRQIADSNGYRGNGISIGEGRREIA